jgi:hypothetical protein
LDSLAAECSISKQEQGQQHSSASLRKFKYTTQLIGNAALQVQQTALLGLTIFCDFRGIPDDTQGHTHTVSE